MGCYRILLGDTSLPLLLTSPAVIWLPNYRHDREFIFYCLPCLSTVTSIWTLKVICIMLLPFWHGFTFNVNSPDKLTLSAFQVSLQVSYPVSLNFVYLLNGPGYTFLSVACVVHSSIFYQGYCWNGKTAFQTSYISTADSVFMISAGLPSTKLCSTHSCGTIDSAPAARFCATTLLRDLLLIRQELPACNLSLPNLFVTWGFFSGTTDSKV